MLNRTTKDQDAYSIIRGGLLVGRARPDLLTLGRFPVALICLQVISERIVKRLWLGACVRGRSVR